MTDEEFERISLYVYRNYGIDLTNKKVIVTGRLENHMRMNGIQTYDEYMDVVENDFSGREARTLVNLITTNHTYFMREFEQMEYFRDVVLPEIKIKAASTKDLRIWCGASSSGEEPYTIAMIIKDFFGLDYNNWETSILATDVSERVLKLAVHGQYQKEQLANMPSSWVKNNFIRLNEEEYVVRQELRNQVIFREFNLMNSIPFKKKLQVVFLRNVMIYFNAETKNQLINRIYDAMEPGGYLFIGSTESIDKDSTEFQYIKPSVFKK